jgi:ligand-binding sensor domain-containing protein
MKNTLSFLITMLTVIFSYSQNLYTEKFDNCITSHFCLDCGDTKAQPPKTIIQEIISEIDKTKLTDLNGTIELQILIDETGKPCLLSFENKTNVISSDLNLKKAINNSSNWTPAFSGEKKENSSVSIILSFENGKVSAKRRSFDFTNQANSKTVGKPELKGTEKNKLSEIWTVFTHKNSELPWDMTRAVVNDLDNNIWIGTDNGIVKINDGNWEHFNSKNSIINPTLYNKKQTQSVRDLEVDKKNNKWFVIGWDVYKYDNEKWTKYDSINSPINWARKVYVDRSNNVWFTSWEGVSKFDGKNWSVINKKNSSLPTDKTLGVFVDSKNRTWIGTFEGNVRIENGKTIQLNDKNSPLSKAFISQMYEDKKGNLWFDLYNDEGTDAGIYILRPNLTWERIIDENKKMFTENSINNFLMDEENNTLWISQNNVGILKYNIEKKSLEIYTNENSNVPSVNIEKITKDKDGSIWAATYAGVIKTNIK